MRIGIDLTGLWRHKTGIFRYAAGISRALLAREDHIAYTLFYRRGEAPPAAAAGGRVRLVATPLRQERLAMQLWFPLARRQLGLDAIHYPAFPPSLFQQRGMIASIHDLTAFRYPETMTAVARHYWRPALRHAARVARPVLVPCAATRADVVALAGAAPERVAVTPYAADPEFARVPPAPLLAAVRARWALPERFLLAVGTLEPRKNLATLFTALERLRGRLTPEPVLVVVGRPGWGPPATAARLHALGASVRFTGHIGDAELVALYHLASVFVYPTLYEGFGFPILEAFLAGCPVISSATSSIPEVAGDAALLLPPRDAALLATTIAELWSDQAHADRLRAAGKEQAARFSWARCAAFTVEAYRLADRAL